MKCRAFLFFLVYASVSGYGQITEYLLPDTLHGLFTPLVMECRMDSAAFKSRFASGIHSAGFYMKIEYVKNDGKSGSILTSGRPHYDKEFYWDASLNRFVTWYFIEFLEGLTGDIMFDSFDRDPFGKLSDSTIIMAYTEHLLSTTSKLSYIIDGVEHGEIILAPLSPDDLNFWSHIRRDEADIYMIDFIIVIAPWHRADFSLFDTDSLIATYPNSSFAKSMYAMSIAKKFHEERMVSDYTNSQDIISTIKVLKNLESKTDLKYFFNYLLNQME